MKTDNGKSMNHKNKKDSKLKVIIFILAILAASIVKFSVSIDGLEDAVHSKIWLGVSFVSGIAAAVIYRKSFLFAGVITTAGFTVAIVLRIVFDLIFVDPTSHKLFHFELMIWCIMALIPAVAGAFLSNMIFRIINKNRTEKKVTKGNS
jgi:NADH:ubiquinone oxidoreductase subunit 6 (subunit J)